MFYLGFLKIYSGVYCKLKNQYQGIERYESGKQYEWSDEIKKLFKPKITTLFSHELPDKGEYISFMDIVYSGDVVSFKDSFRWSNAYLWLMNTLKENNGCLYFDAITEKLHDSLVSDQKPYRKDVKQLLANLLGLIEFLQMEEIVVDRPNYS